MYKKPSECRNTYAHPLYGRRFGHWFLGNHVNSMVGQEKQERLATLAKYRKWIDAHESLQQGNIPAGVFSISGDFAFPILGHIPHSSKRIPDAEKAGLLLNSAELESELLQLTDHHTDELFSKIGSFGKILQYDISRLICDPERFWDDAKEKAAESGFGVIFEKTCDGNELREPVSATRRQELLQTYYFPYHATFELLVDECLDKFDRCLILDCHSFPTNPLPFESPRYYDRPDICIGTDPKHTPEKLHQKIINFFENKGLRVFLNCPYSGAIVPDFYHNRIPSVYSVMIEVNRSLYMDETTGRKNRSFPLIQAMLSECMKMIAAEYNAKNYPDDSDKHIESGLYRVTFHRPESQ